jgi:putative serine protease PepD
VDGPYRREGEAHRERSAAAQGRPIRRGQIRAMTETPNGPHDPQQHDSTSSPQAGRPPYAGPEWRRPDAPATPPAAGIPAPGGQPYGTATHLGQPDAPSGGTPDFRSGQVDTQGVDPRAGRVDGSVQGPGFGRPAAAAPSGPGTANSWAGQHGASRYAGPPQGGAPWPYAAPVVRKGGGKRLVAVAAITAVLGGLAGGGAVTLLDRGNAPAVSAAGISVQGGSAPTAATADGSVEAAAATAMASVVTLSVTGGQESGTGSGVVIRADGYILTNEHVTAVAGSGGRITVAFADGRTATGTLVGADKATDLAVVKVDLTGLTAATFADSGSVKVGQTVVAVGSPLGLDGTVTEGIVSALHRPTTGGSDNSAVIDALQTDAAINPGNSGGALVDLAGRVVGINQSIATASSGSQYGQSSSSGNIGIGFAIPASTASRIAEELISTGSASHAYLGVQTGQSGTATGASVASVESGGPAAAAGLKAGDVVTKVDDRVIGASEELVAAVRSYAPGTEVTLTVRRGTATETVRVTLGSDSA